MNLPCFCEPTSFQMMSQSYTSTLLQCKEGKCIFVRVSHLHNMYASSLVSWTFLCVPVKVWLARLMSTTCSWWDYVTALLVFYILIPTSYVVCSRKIVYIHHSCELMCFTLYHIVGAYEHCFAPAIASVTDYFLPPEIWYTYSRNFLGNKASSQEIWHPQDAHLPSW